ncbi:MAG: FprA family A-type flavoprotein [Oscillospiraceae bacterium]|nr:FprA family A-type flavoprotein [Oscillospiraceae bacterium]
MKKLLDGVYFTGVLNPNMRVFDVIMRTEYGTSYNSYVVRGTDKIALIETAHKSFSALFQEEISEILQGNAPDYLIINHTEPDHSGCVAELLKQFPDIEVFATRAASVYLKNITNITDLRVHVVKDGETLNLGGKTLRFLPAPFLHWPDSMFTYLEEDKVLFSCDFLGAHYCEPGVLDKHFVYHEAYESALKNYFDCIFGPFLPWVRKGLEKIEPLQPDIICPSHGPVLTQGLMLEHALEKYAFWSREKIAAQKRIPIFYCSAYGNTAALAEAVRRGILRVFPQAECETYNIIDHDMAKLEELLNVNDAFAIGCLTMNRDAVPPIHTLLAHADAVNIAKRPAALFGSYGWSGEGFTNTAARLGNLKCRVFEEQFKVTLVPTVDDIAAAEDFGERFARNL